MATEALNLATWVFQHHKMGSSNNVNILSNMCVAVTNRASVAVVQKLLDITIAFYCFTEN